MDIYFYLDNIDNRLNSYEKEIIKTVHDRMFYNWNVYSAYL